MLLRLRQPLMCPYYVRPSVLQRWPIDSRRNRQARVGLERRQHSACLRSEESINWSRVIALLSQRELYVFNDPVWRHICIAGVPVPPSAQHKDYARVGTHPPTAIIPRAVVVVERNIVPTAETIISPIVNDAHVSAAIQRQIACESQISPLMCAVAIFLIRPAVDARPQTKRLLPLWPDSDCASPASES